MKTFKKIILGCFYIPFILLSFIFAIVRFVFFVTIVFTYNLGTEWSKNYIISFSKYLSKLKE